jgi:hypothetical protein
MRKSPVQGFRIYVFIWGNLLCRVLESMYLYGGCKYPGVCLSLSTENDIKMLIPYSMYK